MRQTRPQVLLESDRKGSWVEDGTSFFSTLNVSATLHRLFPLGPNHSRMCVCVCVCDCVLLPSSPLLWDQVQDQSWDEDESLKSSVS